MSTKIIIKKTSCPDGTAVNSDASFTLPVPSGGTAPIPDSQINVNGVNEGDVVSVKAINVNLTDGTNLVTPDSVTLVGNDLNIVQGDVWWKRNPDWLPLPEVNVGDNRFVGLYAVFEDGFNAVAITLNLGTHSIDWGDGNTSSGSGVSQVYNHVYNYSTLAGAVNVYKDGRNYKQVIIRVDYDSSTNQIIVNGQTTPTTGTSLRPQNWLDVILNSTGSLQFNIASAYQFIYLERLIALSNTTINSFNNMSALRVLGYDMTNTPNILFQNCGDFRDVNGQPYNIVSNNLTTLQNGFSSSNISELGDMIFPNMTGNMSSCFANNFNLQKIGDIDLGNTNNFLNAMFQSCKSLKSIGTINTPASAQNLTSMFAGCRSLYSIVFTGTLSGITTTTNAFLNCTSLRRLITPDLTRGLDLRNTQLTGTNLQDWFTSLGTAVGSQTITLPSFTIGEPTTIATGKGFTIAYA